MRSHCWAWLAQWAARVRPKMLALLLRSVRIMWEHMFDEASQG